MKTLKKQFEDYCHYRGLKAGAATFNYDKKWAFAAVLDGAMNVKHFTHIYIPPMENKPPQLKSYVYLSLDDMKNREIVGDFRFRFPCSKKFDSTLNFIYFTTNFPMDFIEQCWEKQGKTLILHLRNKMKTTDGGYFGSYISAGNFMDWFFELSRPNQIQLLEWIDENYDYR